MKDIRNKITNILQEENIQENADWNDIFTTISATMATSGIIGLIGMTAFKKYMAKAARQAKNAADKYLRFRSMIIVTVEENISKLTKNEILGLMNIASKNMTLEEIETSLYTLLEKKPKILDDILKRADPDGYAEIIKKQFPVDGRVLSNGELATILTSGLDQQAPPAPEKPTRSRKPKQAAEADLDDVPDVDPSKLN